MIRILFTAFLLLNAISTPVLAAELQTNSTYSPDVPSWVNKSLIDHVTERIQNFMEWDIHRVTVIFYKDEATFEKAHGLGPTVMAVSHKQQGNIWIGPRVNASNFDQYFGHELVHIILFQKYKDAVPGWFEEGLANYVAKSGTVDYKWLNSKPFPKDVRGLTHPFDSDVDNTRYHYMASQALAEMIAAKCDLKELLRLSVGAKLDSYLDTYCNITDLNGAYQKWIKSKAH